MAILRAFIAIELDQSVRAGLDQLQRRLRAEPISGFVRWVAPSSMHLTLKFLGDVDSARVPGSAMRRSCGAFGWRSLTFPTSRT